MFGRGLLFVGIIIAAFFAPYFVMRDGQIPPGGGVDGLRMPQNGDLAGWWGRTWNSMWTDSLDSPSGHSVRRATPSSLPTATATPLPAPGFPSVLSGGGVPTTVGPRTQIPVSTQWTTVPGSTIVTTVSPGFVASGVVPGSANQPNLGGLYGQGLAAAIRLDVTPQWVTQQWHQGVSQVADASLRGLRVPYVSGTSPSDCAGSLTYYFDRKQTVQRVVLAGSTGDPSPIVALATQQFGFRPASAFIGSLYLSNSEQRSPVGGLQVKPGAATAANGRAGYDIFLEVNRPGEGARLSQAFQDSLDASQGKGFWSDSE